jgi:hypothetical protein
MPLTLTTWPRFVPALRHYAAKGLSRAGEKLFNGNSPSPDLESVRMRLWRDERVREILNPARMRLNQLIEPVRLYDFLDSSRRPDFAFDHQWRRVLSLEMALRVLHHEI